MSVKTKVQEIAKTKNMDLDKFCSWLLEERKDDSDIFKTIDKVVFKSVGVCRYYDFYAKFEGESDDKFVEFNMFRD